MNRANDAVPPDAPRPVRLWSFDRATEVATADRYVRSEAARALCYGVIDAVLDVRRGGVVTADHVAAFARAAEADDGYTSEQGARRLVQCARAAPAAADALRALASHRRWRPRFNAVNALAYGPPDALALELLGRGLADPSERVATRAADACDQLRDVPGVIALLDQRLAAETRPKVRASLELNAGLARTPEVREGRYLVREYRGVKYAREAPGG